MKKSTKKRIARTMAVGISGVLYTILSANAVMLFTEIIDPTLSISDSGIVLEIFGFLIFLPVIRNRLSKNLGETYPDWGEETIRHIIELFAILTIISGLILQFSIFT